MKKIRTICCALLLILVAQALYADENKTLTRKSPEDATLRSLAGTFGPILVSMPFLLQDVTESNWNEAVGIGFLSTGVLFGPGLGHLYSKNSEGFRKGLIARAIGGGMLLAGVDSYELFDDSSKAELLIISGGLIVLVSMIHDIATADGAARRYNERVGLTQVSVVPTYNSQTGGVGMNLSFRF